MTDFIVTVKPTGSFSVTVHPPVEPVVIISPFQQVQVGGGSAATSSYALAALIAATASVADASKLTGTLNDGTLSSNVPLKNAANQFTNNQSVTGSVTATTVMAAPTASFPTVSGSSTFANGLTASGSIRTNQPITMTGNLGGLGGGTRYIGTGGTAGGWFFNASASNNVFLASNEVIALTANSASVQISAPLFSALSGSFSAGLLANVRGLGLKNVLTDTLVNAPQQAFGGYGAFIPEIHDVLYGADTRFIVSSSNFFANSFSGVFTPNVEASGARIQSASTGVVTITMNSGSEFSVSGSTYPDGFLYVTYYFTNTPASASARVQTLASGSLWTALAAPVNVSSTPTYTVTRFTVPGTNYLTDIELTVTAPDTSIVIVTGIQYYQTRPVANPVAYFSKVRSNRLYGNTSWYNSANAQTAQISTTGVGQFVNVNTGNTFVSGTVTINGGAANNADLLIQTSGGTVSRNWRIQANQSNGNFRITDDSGGTVRVTVDTAGAVTASGAVIVGAGLTVTGSTSHNGSIIFAADNTNDIGNTAANRPRNVNVAGNLIAAGGGHSLGTAGLSSLNLTLNTNTGSFKGLTYLSNGVNRWSAFVNGGESTGNLGAGFTLAAYDDAGTLIDIPFSIVRAATGAISFARPTTITSTLNVTGAVTASAFTGSGAGITGVVSSSYALSASYAPGNPSVSASYALTSSYAVSASYAPGSPSISASYALSASYAPSSPSVSASYALTASYAATVDFSGIGNKPALVSSSAQVSYPSLSNIPAGIVSSSGQVSYVGLSGIPAGIHSASAQVAFSGITGVPAGLVSSSGQVSYPALSGIPSGIVSSSAQVSYPALSGIPAGIVSSSNQVSYGGLTGIPSGIVSSSAQINATVFTATGSFTGSFKGDGAGVINVVSSSYALSASLAAIATAVDYSGVANKPALVSASAQITYAGLTGIPAGIVSSSVQINTGSFTGSHVGAITAQSLTFSSNVLASADATYDIGATGANRPRNVYVSNAVTASAFSGNGAGLTAVTASAVSSSRYTTLISSSTTLVSNATYTGSFTVGSPEVRLLMLSGSGDARLRVYPSASYRNNDLSRAMTTEPSSSAGLLLDAVFTGSTKVFPASPLVALYNLDPVTTNTLYYTVTNLAVSTVAVSCSLTLVQ